MYIFRVPNVSACTFFRVPKSPKLSIFLSLGLSSTFGSPPPSYVNGCSPPGLELSISANQTISVTGTEW